ncbi:MAG: NifU family protein [Planctomycetia bacterium]
MTDQPTTEPRPASPAPASPAPAPTHDPAAHAADVQQILQVLQNVRPYLNADGGDVEFLSYEEGIVNVRLHGACGTCPSSLMTLRMGIENALREVVPGVQEVRNVAPPPAPPGAPGTFQLRGLS